MNNKDLQTQISELRRKLRCSAEILHSDGPLSGAVSECFTFGIDNTTGDLYYKNDVGDWELTLLSAFTAVDNGLTNNAGTIRLGQTLNQAGAPATLTATREVPLGAFSMVYTMNSPTNNATNQPIQLYINNGNRIFYQKLHKK